MSGVIGIWRQLGRPPGCFIACSRAPHIHRRHQGPAHLAESAYEFRMLLCQQFLTLGVHHDEE